MTSGPLWERKLLREEQFTETYLEDRRRREEFAEAEKAKEPPRCCRSMARYGYHDAYCSQNFSRSAGS